MVFGELVPKNLAIARPYRSAVMFGIPMQVVNRFLRPLILFLNNAANWTVRRMGVEPREELAGVRSIEEMELMIRSAAEGGQLDDDELKLLTRAITFSEKTVAGDAMIPRVDVIGIRSHDSIVHLRRLAQETGHSRFPVYEEAIDDITGVVHVKDTFNIAADSRAAVPVAQITRPVVRAPETQPLGQLLIELQTSGHHMAVVVDEYGGTAGIVTIEDMLEEIVGEIADEHDPEPKPSRSREGAEDVLGRLHRHEIEELTGFSWPEGRYDTLGGFLIAHLGRFPATGESVHVGPWTFEIVAMDGYRIDRVVVHRPPPEVPEESGP